MELTQRQELIIVSVIQNGTIQSSELLKVLAVNGNTVSLITVKRELSQLVKKGYLKIQGIGRSTSYITTVKGRLFAKIKASEYCAIEPDQRYGLSSYNFELFSSMPPHIFTKFEQEMFDKATAEYEKRTEHISPTIQKKELERLIIELSWKSSRIEGNTYSLLDTEKLILENKEAIGHDKKEAQMILNHKDAFNFVRDYSSQYKTLTKTNLEELHKILIKGLSVDYGLRSKPVGIIGSKYQPLDTIYQITEGIEGLSQSINRIDNPYAKALIALLGISYLQPFEDGNKRTARLMANAILLAYKCAPLSYRSVEENEYREAVLVFYEINSLVPFKKIFLTQCDFAARTYAVK